MKAILYDTPGSADQLYLGETQKPVPEADELLVRVAATALNRADLMQREGRYPPPPGVSKILGLELAGTVEAVGAGVTGWQPGDRVCGLLPGGGYAEYAVLPHRMAMPVPPVLSFTEAAAIPEVFLTAFQALRWIGKVEAGQRVLIHAGASGVGTAAIQLAQAMGATPFVTASAGKHEVCLKLGAATAIDYRREDFADRVQELTDGQGVNLVIDFIGAPYFERNIKVLSMDGGLVLLSMLGGQYVEGFNLTELFRKRARIEASTLRSRSVEYKIRLTQDFAASMLPLFQERQLKPVIDSVYEWSDVKAAHEHMEANKNIGKIVLNIYQ